MSLWIFAIALKLIRPNRKRWRRNDIVSQKLKTASSSFCPICGRGDIQHQQSNNGKRLRYLYPECLTELKKEIFKEFLLRYLIWVLIYDRVTPWLALFVENLVRMLIST
jgi:ribosomal protein L32